MMRYGLWSSRRTFTASELAILSHATGALRPPHPVASTITLTNSRLRIRSLPSSLTRVVRRRALGQPIPKRRPPSPRAQGQAPLFEDRQCHRAHAALRRSRGRALLEQPRLELIRVWVGSDGAIEQIALDREADRIGRRVALATLPPAFRGFEGREQLAAQLRWSWGWHNHNSTTLTSNAKPGRSGRWYPRSRAATSRATVTTSSSSTPHQGSSLTVGSAFTYPLHVSHTSTLRVVSPSSGARYPKFS